jgi:ankyrin repeat protein
MKINIVLVIMMSLAIVMISGCAHAPRLLISAVEVGDIEEVRVLLKECSDVNARNNLGETVLHKAVINHRSDIIRILLDAGADVNIKDQWGKTPLFLAAYNGSIESVALLLDKGPDVNAKDNHGKTPLVSAAEGNHADIIKLLISKGADLDTAIAWTESVAVKNPQGSYWVATAKLLAKFAPK